MPILCSTPHICIIFFNGSVIMITFSHMYILQCLSLLFLIFYFLYAHFVVFSSSHIYYLFFNDSVIMIKNFLYFLQCLSLLFLISYFWYVHFVMISSTYIVFFNDSVVMITFFLYINAMPLSIFSYILLFICSCCHV